MNTKECKPLVEIKLRDYFNRVISKKNEPTTCREQASKKLRRQDYFNKAYMSYNYGRNQQPPSVLDWKLSGKRQEFLECLNQNCNDEHNMGESCYYRDAYYLDDAKKLQSYNPTINRVLSKRPEHLFYKIKWYDLIYNNIKINFKDNCFHKSDDNCLHKIVYGNHHFRYGGHITLENGEEIDQSPIDVIYKRIRWDAMFDGADKEDIDYDNYMRINQRRVYDKEYYAFDDIKNGGKNNKSKKQNNRFSKRL